MLENVKACFFDMDGTLIDSVWIWTDIDRDFLTSRGIIFDEQIQKKLDGMNFNQVANFFKNEFHLKETIEELKEIWHEMAYKKYCNEVPLKDSAQKLLSLLKATGIKLGIATSNSKYLAMACLKALEIEQLFDVIMTGDDVSVGKPSPDIYLECARACKVNPAECLVFEDIPVGIEAGHNAGMKVCTIYDKYSEDVDMLKHETADYYIYSFNEVCSEVEQ